MSEDPGIGRQSAAPFRPLVQPALAQAEKLYRDQIRPHRKPVVTDQQWRRATRRLEVLGMKRRGRLRLPAPANDRGHRHSRLLDDDRLGFRLLSAACVAMASIALLVLIGAAVVEPNTLLGLPR